jgi:hypothetical protein
MNYSPPTGNAVGQTGKHVNVGNAVGQTGKHVNAGNAVGQTGTDVGLPGTAAGQTGNAVGQTGNATVQPANVTNAGLPGNPTSAGLFSFMKRNSELEKYTYDGGAKKNKKNKTKKQ